MIFAPKYKEHSPLDEIELLGRLSQDEKITLQFEALKQKNLQSVESLKDLIKMMESYPLKKSNEELEAIWEFLEDWDTEHTTIDFTTNRMSYDFDADHIVISPIWITYNFNGYQSIEEYKDEIEINIIYLEDMTPDDIVEQRMYDGDIFYATNGYILSIPEHFPWFETIMLRDFNNE
jgi:hypothetical protein